jgi:hypothetical protein
MELLGKLVLLLHILAGTTTLIAGPVAIFYNFRDVRRHRRAGKIFFYAMVVVCLTAAAGVIRQPDAVFFQFLLGVAAVVLAGVLRGVRAIHFMHGRPLAAIDYAYTALLGVFALYMLALGAWHLQRGTMVAFPILFAVFGLGAAFDMRRNRKLFRHFNTVEKMTWYRLHVSSMLAAFTASTTAFTVVSMSFLPWFVQWFGPTLLLLPLQFYFGRKLKERTRAVAAA